MSVYFNPTTPKGIVGSVDPVQTAAVLAAIESRDGRVTPAAVVAEASSPSSPIHSFFEWNDGKAAHAYRLKQARTLIAMLYVQPVATATSVTVAVRAVPHVPGVGGGYMSQATVSASPTLAVRLVEEYDRQLRSLYQRNLANERALKASKVGPVVTAIEDYLKANPKP